MNSKPGRPVLVLFQQTRGATVRKARSISNDAPSGGGARDLRISPYRAFEPFMQRLFPNVRQVSRPRGGTANVRWATATWGEGDETTEVEYWPPTRARPTEGRIARISALAPLGDPPQDAEQSFILFIRDDNEIVWIRYATVRGLVAGMPEISEPIQRCLNNAKSRRIPTGYIDLTPEGLGVWCNV